MYLNINCIFIVQYSFTKKLLKIIYNELYLSVYPYTKLQYCIFYGDFPVKELGPNLMALLLLNIMKYGILQFLLMNI